MEKVQIKQVNSANVRVDNLINDNRVYSISSNVNIGINNTNITFDGGEVLKEGLVVASFNLWGESNLNISYINAEAEERCDILTSIDNFILDTKSYIGTQGVVAINNIEEVLS